MSEQTINETIEVDEPEQLQDEVSSELKYATLEVWEKVLGAARGAFGVPVTLYQAREILSGRPRLGYGDVQHFHNLYHGVMADAADEVLEVIQAHPSCTEFVGEADGKENRKLYLEILARWNKVLMAYEGEWHPEAEDAAVQADAIGTAREVLFGPMGLIQHLSAINVDISNDEFEAACDAIREEK